MSATFNIAAKIDKAVRAAAARTEGFTSAFEPEIRPADPRFGDFQANGILAFARSQKTNPRALAQALVASLQADATLLGPEYQVSIAGPGFINFSLSSQALLQWLQQFRTPEQLRAAAAHTNKGQTVIVDFSSPNTAKQMHVGHIRSTVIGESLSRLLEFCGATVIRDNHIGDWGTQFGIIIAAIKNSGFDLDNPGPDPLAAIEQLYKDGNQHFKESEQARDQARQELVRLQQGDPENTALWEKITEISWHAFDAIYRTLDVHFDECLGESFYRDKVDRVYRELQECGLAIESDGALVVFHPEHPRFATQPFIVRKADGASNYASTDLATLLYRVEHFAGNRILYVVGAPQSDHFEQLFLTAQKWFKAKGYPLPELDHVAFGTVLDKDGKAIKTRDGQPIKLQELFDEAIERAYTIVSEKNPELSAEEKQHIAHTVGIAAVKYVDLSQNRTSDYIFAWDKVLSFDGNTAPYLLYAVARIHSIFRRLDIDPNDSDIEAGASAFTTDTELALARKLVAFPVALSLTLNDLRPHLLCNYLYELSGTFSSFYNADKVIVDDSGTMARRLLLCNRTLRTLETGLQLLGIRTLERM